MPTDPRDYHLDIRSQPLDVPDRASVERDKAGQKFLSVMFSCCKVYSRVYPSKDGTRYEARCPRCLRAITFRVGADGTSERAFVVG